MHAHRAPPKRIVSATMPFEEVERLDRRLVELGRGVGAMRVSLGEGLIALEGAGGFGGLGFPTLASYALEALGMSGRWAGDARALARRLEPLPKLRAALVSGRLSWSKVELLVRVASSDEEERWIEQAESMTVRALRAAIRNGDEVADEAETPPKTTLSVTVDRYDAMAFELARLMVRSVGARGMDEAVEAMLAEGLTEMLARVPDLDLPAGIGGGELERAWREELMRMRREGEEACEARGFLNDDGTSVAVGVREPEWPTDRDTIDGKLRSLAKALARRDLELGHLARRAFEGAIWGRLGYGSFEQYVRERVGLSASGVSARIALSRRVAGLPLVEEALVDGRIGFEAAGIVARVASPRTEATWCERAARTTVKLLREEVEAVELVARVEGRDIGRLGPPDEATLESVHDVERAVIGSLTDGCQMSGSEEPDGTEVPRGLPTRTMRLTVSEDTARFWRALERTFAGIFVSGSFVAFLASAVAGAWRGAIGKAQAGGEYADVYRRDRWCCRSPVCRSNNVSPHHVRFRSRGGGEERSNLLSLCEACHLDLMHGGHLWVSGDAGIGGVLRWAASGWRAVGRDAA